MTVYITLNQIRKAQPCTDGWKKVLKAHEHLGMDTPFPLSSVLESNDLADTLWCFGAIDNKEIPQRFALWCARQVETEDSKKALDVVEQYLDGKATKDELIVTSRAVDYAAYAADAAADAADAACAACAACAAVDYAVDAADYAAVDAACAVCADYAARRAADAARCAAYAARRADYAAAADAACAAADAARQAQVAKLKEMLS
jgi:hypothetical protein